MLSVLPVLLGLCALVSARCGTLPNESIKALHAAYQAHEAATAHQPARRQAFAETVNAYVHVITNDTTPEGGYVSEEVIRRQVGVHFVASFAALDNLVPHHTDFR
jgi:hypothetical protein